jgi:hypothetical protein
VNAIDPPGNVVRMSYDYGDGSSGRLVVQTMPEPATLGMMGAAGVGLMVRRRRCGTA